MPTIEVNDITIAYKVRGEGPLVVYTPAGFWTMDRTEPIVDASVKEGFQILVYDRINSGIFWRRLRRARNDVGIRA